MTLDDFSWVTDGIIELLGYTMADLKTAFIGNPTNHDTEVEDSDKKGLWWVHGLQPDPESPFTAVNAIPYASKYLEYGAPVLVRQFTNGYFIVNFDPDLIWQFFGDRDRYRIDQQAVSIDQLSYATLQPNSPVADMTVILKSGLYVVDDTRYLHLDIRSADFSTDPLDVEGDPIELPTTFNVATGVLVQYYPSTGTISYKQADFEASLTLPRAFLLGRLPAPDSGAHFGVGYLKLLMGMPFITKAHIWTAPEFLSKSSFDVDKILTSEGRVLVDVDGNVLTL